jgi:hypothetical protein
MKTHRIIILKSRNTDGYCYGICYGNNVHVYNGASSEDYSKMLVGLITAYKISQTRFSTLYCKQYVAHVVKETDLASHYAIVKKYKSMVDLIESHPEYLI